MFRVEQEIALMPNFTTTSKLTLVGLSIFSLVISYLFFKNTGEAFTFYPLNMKISGTPIFLILTVILLYAINYWLNLQSEIRIMKKKSLEKQT